MRSTFNSLGGGGGGAVAKVNPEEFSHKALEKYERVLDYESKLNASLPSHDLSLHKLLDPNPGEEVSALIADILGGASPRGEVHETDNGYGDDNRDQRLVDPDDNTHFSVHLEQVKDDQGQGKAEDVIAPVGSVIEGGLPYLVTKLGLYRRALILERAARGRSESALAALTNQLHATSAALLRRDRIISDLLVDLVSLEQALHLQRSATGSTGGALPPAVLDVVRGNPGVDESGTYATGGESVIEDRLNNIFSSAPIDSRETSSGSTQLWSLWLAGTKDKVRELLTELESLKTSFRVLHKDAAEERANLRQKLLLAGRDAAANAEDRRHERSRFQTKLGEARQAVQLLRNEVNELREQCTEKENVIARLKKLLYASRKALLSMASGDPRQNQRSVPGRGIALSQSKLDLTAEIRRVIGDELDELSADEVPSATTSNQGEASTKRDIGSSSPQRSSTPPESSVNRQISAGAATAEATAATDKLLRSVSSMEMVPEARISDFSSLVRSTSDLTAEIRRQQAASQVNPSPTDRTASPSQISVAAIASGQATVIGAATAGGAIISEAELRSLREELAEARRVNEALARRAFEYKQRLDTFELRLKKFAVTRILHFRPSEPYELTIKKITSTGEVFICLTQLASVSSSSTSAPQDNQPATQGQLTSVDEETRGEYSQLLETVTIRPLPNPVRFLLIFTADGNRQMTFDCDTPQLRESIISAIDEMKSAL